MYITMRDEKQMRGGMSKKPTPPLGRKYPSSTCEGPESG